MQPARGIHRAKTTPAPSPCRGAVLTPPLYTARHQHRLLCRCQPPDHSSSGGNEGGQSLTSLTGDAATQRALDEAAQLFQQAQDMTHQQVLQELRDATVSDVQRTRVELRPKLDEAAQSQAMAALQAFWLEQGCTGSTARRMAEEVMLRRSPFSTDVAALAAQLQRLAHVIPCSLASGGVQSLVAKDVGLLDASPLQVAHSFIELVDLFPGIDISAVVERHPQLLHCGGLTSRYQRVVAKLTELHPSHSRREVVAVVRDHPELLFRMDYHWHVRVIDELPIEMQNWMIVTGQGLAALHKMYNPHAASGPFGPDLRLL